MKKEFAAEMLREAWIDYLQKRGHQVTVPAGFGNTVTSYSPEYNSFRWLLFVAEGRIKNLSHSQTRRLAGEIKLAKQHSQKPYVVVRFTIPKPKLIVTPADKVLETGRIDSARGGIPWCE